MRRPLLRLRLRLNRRVVVGRGVHVGRRARVEAAPGARVVLGDGCRIEAGAHVAARGGAVRIAPGAVVGERSILVAHAGIDVGERARIGDWVVIADAEPVFADPEIPVRAQGVRATPVRIAPGAVVAHAARVRAGAVVDARVDPGATVPSAR